MTARIHSDVRCCWQQRWFRAASTQARQPMLPPGTPSVSLDCAGSVYGILAPDWRSQAQGAISSGPIIWPYLRQIATHVRSRAPSQGKAPAVKASVTVKNGAVARVSIPTSERASISLDYTYIQTGRDTKSGVYFRVADGASEATFKACPTGAGYYTRPSSPEGSSSRDRSARASTSTRRQPRDLWAIHPVRKCRQLRAPPAAERRPRCSRSMLAVPSDSGLRRRIGRQARPSGAALPATGGKEVHLGPAPAPCIGVDTSAAGGPGVIARYPSQPVRPDAASGPWPGGGVCFSVAG